MKPAIQERDGEACPESGSRSTVEWSCHNTVEAHPEGVRKELGPAPAHRSGFGVRVCYESMPVSGPRWGS